VRILYVIAAITLICCAASAADVGLEVLAPISRDDVRKITNVIKGVTPREITLIRAVQSDRPPFETYDNRVWVAFGHETTPRDTYCLQKRGTEWYTVQRGVCKP
jgi:hypothetical protein